jgi:isopenicillin N synthase-like dioxygenase
MTRMTELGHAIMEGLALGLGHDADWFRTRYTGDPLTLFRIFNYPAAPTGDEAWGVGEHTDYGVLTILAQDDAGGLEVRSGDRWIAAPPLAGSFVCNIGDMLERMTQGRYRSTPHRVRNPAPRDRLSLPFFFDPNFRARIEATNGTYGDYILAKVAKVFPALGEAVLVT